MSSTNEGLDDSRCKNIDNWLYKERMEEYTFFIFSRSGPERCRLKESVGKFCFGVSSSFFLHCGVQRFPPVLF